VGVKYPGMQFGTFKTYCTADDYSGVVDWSAGSEPITTSAVPHTIFYKGANRTVVDAGSYTILEKSGTATHVYGQVGPYSASINGTGSLSGSIRPPETHCCGYRFRVCQDTLKENCSTRGFVPRAAQTTLKRIQINPDSSASPADTHVDLKWSGAVAVLGLCRRMRLTFQQARDVFDISIPTKPTTTVKR